MNELDQFVKHRLKIRYYIRFADDFVILSDDVIYLENLLPELENFLDKKLKLKIHQQKLSIKTFSSGADFLGWINFPDHKILRTTSKRRMMRRIKANQSDETISSYLGLMSHGNTYKIKKKFLNFVEQNKKLP